MAVEVTVSDTWW